ncbi:MULTISPECIES: T9SS type A sorting domain-containing protein [unclassified Lentimicrobium]|uniref:T9SS type A sorting domain-containing protein n=1 Tax=unclassified Lentimicrobium TaxID=2677434 RepID=UPI00155504EB|nr:MULTISPECIES: T9SS type A sorting domain-containing protein [unclassified Lentimicrobium]NPD47457.1 T9SS type A sorting domain-containing protein [Lentimicrobium sp. S6]NPD87010.1 T9SS type A sorting domain-containing protein [Lentimicrobium sp. L6]
MKKTLLFIVVQLLIFNGFAQDWDAVGGGTNGSIKAMIEYEGDLIVGGYFTEAGGQEAACVARWDGSQWHPMGNGFAGEVLDFEIYGGWLYASGWFFSDPNYTQEYEGIARWTGSAWSPVIDYDPVSWGGEIYDMLVFNNELYITNHSIIGSEGVSRVSKFNGATWTDLPGAYTHSGNQGQIYTLEIYNDQLIAGGLFDEVDGNAVKNVARFNGSNWESLNMFSNGLYDKVYKLLVYNNDLYAGGIFFDPFYTTLQKYDGSNWSIYQMNIDVNLWDIQDLMIYDDELFVSGVFYYEEGPNNISACSVLKETEDTYRWLDLSFFNSNSTQWIGFAMCAYNGDLYLGGDFQYAGSQDDPKNNIARFNGQIPTTIQEFQESENATIFPNPASNLIYFNEDFSDNQNLIVQVYDLSGRLVLEHKLEQNWLNIYDLNNGLYQIKVSGGQNEYRGRFIKAD